MSGAFFVRRLTYSIDSEIIGSCSSEFKRIKFQSENVLLNTWQQCDGPGFENMKNKMVKIVEFQFLVYI
jgi:hypothetical protein